MFYFKKPDKIYKNTNKIFRKLRRYSIGYYIGLIGLIILAIINLFRPSIWGLIGIIMACAGYYSLQKLFEYEQNCVSVLLDDVFKENLKKRCAMKG